MKDAEAQGGRGDWAISRMVERSIRLEEKRGGEEAQGGRGAGGQGRGGAIGQMVEGSIWADAERQALSAMRFVLAA